MATKKKSIDPAAAAVTIALVGFSGWALWTFVIKPYRDKKKAASMAPVDSIPGEILDAQFEIVNEQQT